MQSRETAAGTIISGRYEIQRMLGRGGVGVVWRARDRLLGRDVAVKEVIFPLGGSQEDRSSMQARVLREARAAARLSGPGVVTVFDVLQDEGRTYIVMELVDAPSLAELVQREGPLSPLRTAQIAEQVLRVLEAAHEKGIVHRDVKPGNVIVGANGEVKLTDFGIASVTDDTNATTTGILLGSPSYIAPEQAEGRGSGPPADLWGLGGTMYFAVEGAAPFDCGQVIATLRAVVQEPPRPPRSAGRLGPVILALLRKDPEDRPSTREVSRMLEAVIEEEEAVTVPVATPLLPDTAVLERPPAREPPAGHRPEWRWVEDPHRVERQGTRARRHRGRAWIPVGVSALALAAVFFFFSVARQSLVEPERPDTGRRQAAVGRTTPTGAASPAPGISPGALAESPAPDEEESADTGDEGSAPQGVPEGWIPYTDEASGYRIWYPPDWDIVPITSFRTDFRDPNSRTYLRVEWTDDPGDSPKEDWEAFSKDFAERHSNYRKIGITATTYQGYEAALWEFTYTEEGVRLHAADLGFIAGDYGFALFFQAREEDWAASQDLFSAFKESFRAPA